MTSDMHPSLSAHDLGIFFQEVGLCPMVQPGDSQRRQDD
jgi:hypothetical protein